METHHINAKDEQQVNPIPSSPIAQNPAKIGKRYVAVHRYESALGGFPASWAWPDKRSVEQWMGNCDLYPLLDPTDAAELERLRKVEDEAADAMFAVWTDLTIYLDSPVTMAFCKARAARIAFEAKIGGGK